MHLYAFFGVKKYSGFLMHFSKEKMIVFFPKNLIVSFSTATPPQLSNFSFNFLPIYLKVTLSVDY